jgi:hypothetical protein
MHAPAVISGHPEVRGNDNAALMSCIEACFECAQTCIVCAEACAAEQAVTPLRHCIRLSLHCADVCSATGAIAAWPTGGDEWVLRTMLQACAEACRLRPEECSAHAHEHCRICAEACERCERVCAGAAGALVPAGQ